jgi:TonB family protein
MMNFKNYDEKDFVAFKIPWDKNTYTGWILSIILILIIILLLPFYNLEPPRPIELQRNVIPIELLSFGQGDGTGGNKGNLSEEGKAYKGPTTTNQLEDAKIATDSKNFKKSDIQPEDATYLKPSGNPSTNEQNNQNERGSDSRNIGKANGDAFGSGLGDKGFGNGSGRGFGDIDWGGGGNRIVIYKKIPQYPPGVNASGTIRIQFTVLQDGTIDKMFPLEKADPRLEKAAMDALRQWRFNSISQNVVQVGIITLNFKLH